MFTLQQVLPTTSRSTVSSMHF